MATFTTLPGTFVRELPATPTVRSVGIDTPGFVGIAAKGPVNTLRLITSLTQFEQEFGNNYTLDGSIAYLWYSVRAFFNEGGASCYIVRVVPTDAATATRDFAGMDCDPTTVTSTVTATSGGDWANQVSVSSAKLNTTFQAASVTSPVSVFEVASVTGVELGDVVLLPGDVTGAGPHPELIQPIVEIDTTGANPTIRVPFAIDYTSGTDPAVDEAVRIVGAHKFRGTLVAAVTTDSANWATTGVPTFIDLTLNSAASLVPGQILIIAGQQSGETDWTNTLFFAARVQTTVSLSDRDRVFFDNTTVPGFEEQGTVTSLGTPTLVTSMELNFQVFENGSVVETHQFLSNFPGNTRDFIGGSTDATNVVKAPGRLFGERTESNRISVDIKNSGAAANPLTSVRSMICTDGLQLLSGGADGTRVNLTFSQWTDSIDILKEADLLAAIAAPDAPGDTAVQGYLSDTAGNLATTVALIDPSFQDSDGNTAPDEILNWRNNVLNRDTSYSALYWPWPQVNDPDFAAATAPDAGAFSLGFGEPLISIPPSGHAAGQFARVVFEQGIEGTPANIPLRGVAGLSYETGAADHNRLNARGINVIRKFSGQGYRIFGGRTLFSTENGKHYVAVRRVLIAIGEAIRRATLFAVFRPNTTDLWAELESVVRDFLFIQWRDGVLFGETEEQAFFVRCNEQTTTPADRKAGRVNCLVGLNVVFPAEQVFFNISLFEGQTSVVEVAASSVDPQLVL